MMRWYKVVSVGKDEKGEPKAPPVPTYGWTVSSFYTRDRAAIHYGVGAMSIVVNELKGEPPCEASAIELLAGMRDGVETRPLVRTCGRCAQIDEALAELGRAGSPKDTQAALARVLSAVNGAPYENTLAMVKRSYSLVVGRKEDFKKNAKTRPILDTLGIGAK